MIKYIVDKSGTLHVVGSNTVPEGAVAKAPDAAEFADGPHIDLTPGSEDVEWKPGRFVTFTQTAKINNGRKATETAASNARIAANNGIKTARLAKLNSLKARKGQGPIATGDLNQVLIDLIEALL